MSRSPQIKLIFVDGPLEGQTRFINKDDLLSARTYRVYVPNTTLAMQKNFDLGPNESRVVCAQVDYIPFNIPSSYGTERYIMCQQGMGLGN